jgi:hypothetical protein
MIRVIDADVAPYYSFFKHGQITYYGYMFAIFARKEFTKDIRPTCRLRYKQGKTPNVKFNFADPNFAKAFNVTNMGYNPAQIAALKRKWARTEHRKSEYVSTSNVQFIIAISNKREIALKKLATLLKTGLKLKPGIVELFNEKLEAKFPPTPSPPKPRVPSPPKPRVPSPPKPQLFLNSLHYNSIVNFARNFENGNKSLRALLNAGYKIKDPKNYNNFLQKLRNKFVKPKPFTFAEAKAHLNKFKTVTARKKAYANVWRGLSMGQRRILMHYRNKGVWLNNKNVSN